MFLDCFEEAIQQQLKKSVEAVADGLPLATHRAICKGKGVELPLKEDFPIKCEGLQFPILELFSSVERTLVWGGDFELEFWSSPHQLCDLGRVTFYHEVSVFPLENWDLGQLNSKIPFSTVLFSDL